MENEINVIDRNLIVKFKSLDELVKDSFYFDKTYKKYKCKCTELAINNDREKLFGKEVFINTVYITELYFIMFDTRYNDGFDSTLMSPQWLDENYLLDTYGTRFNLRYAYRYIKPLMSYLQTISDHQLPNSNYILFNLLLWDEFSIRFQFNVNASGIDYPYNIHIKFGREKKPLVNVTIFADEFGEIDINDLTIITNKLNEVKRNVYNVIEDKIELDDTSVNLTL